LAPVQPGTVTVVVVDSVVAGRVVVVVVDGGVAEGWFDEHPARASAPRIAEGTTIHRARRPAPWSLKS
jgi:hypothetical protein